MTLDLQVTTTPVRDRLAVLAAVGELTVHTGDTLVQHATQAADNGHVHQILDLEKVPFCDSTGLGALIRIYRHLTAAGGTLTIAAVPDRLQRLLTLTNIDRLIPAHPTTQDALAPWTPLYP